MKKSLMTFLAASSVLYGQTLVDPNVENIAVNTAVPGILSDLRVYVDAQDEKGNLPTTPTIYTWPITNPTMYSRESVENQVLQGLRYWASFMPGMHVRVVTSSSQANFVVRFRKYEYHIAGRATAESFFPSPVTSLGGTTPGWNTNPDFSCGAGTLWSDADRLANRQPTSTNYYTDNDWTGDRKSSHNSAGVACDERANNIMMFQMGNWTLPSEVVLLAGKMRHDYWSTLSNRSDPNRRAFIPKGMTNPSRGDCVTGTTNGTEFYFGNDVCVPYKDLGPNAWASNVDPNFPWFGISQTPLPWSNQFRIGADLVSVVQHEFGHTIVGGHTGQANDQQLYEDVQRNPVHMESQMVRKRPTLTWPSVSSYSTMYPGWGDAAFNIRGVFELDAQRAEQNLFTQTTGRAHRVIYPAATGIIRMTDRAGTGSYLTANWVTALAKGQWRGSSRYPTYPDWYVAEAFPEAITQQKVGVGDFHTVAVKVDGTLWGWGKNDLGQASGDGIPTSSPVLNPKQIKVSGVSDNGWVSAAAGMDFSVALRADGTLYAWGRNDAGTVGDGSFVNRSAPTRVCNNSGQGCYNVRYVSVTAGALHIAALADNGTIWAWGYNGEGQVGNNTNGNQVYPVQEWSGANDWISVSAGSNHTLALKRDGTIRTWGYNVYGQLGNGGTSNSLVPVRDAANLTRVVSIDAGLYHNVVLLDNHTLYAWGQNDHAEVNTPASPAVLAPTLVPPTSNWQSVRAGAGHTVGLASDGGIWSHGDNQDGELGDGTTTNRPSQVRETTASTAWTYIFPRFYSTMAMRADGSLYGWGYNEFGQLGNGSAAIRVTTPVKSNWTYGVLNGSGPATASTANLSTEGTLGWSHFGYPSASDYDFMHLQEVNLMREGTVPTLTAIYNPLDYQLVGSVSSTAATGAVAYTWNNGTTTATANGIKNAPLRAGVGNGWKVFAPAGTTPRTFKVYVAVTKGQGKLVAHMSDGSAPDYTSTALSNSTGTSSGVYTFTFASASNAKFLNVSWTLNSTPGGGSVSMQAATLH